MRDRGNPSFDDYSADDHERVRQTCLHLAALARMHARRLTGYAAIGYRVQQAPAIVLQ